MAEHADGTNEILAILRSACLGLPEVIEEQASSGPRWRIRSKTFAQVHVAETRCGVRTVVIFRSSGAELEALQAMGHPFFRPSWGTNVVGMVLAPGLDPAEITELLTESYCIMAPKKLAASVDRPAE